MDKNHIKVPQLFLYWSSKFHASRHDNFRLPVILIEDLIQKTSTLIDLEKSFPTSPNMTYFACVKAVIIASEVDFANKTKKLIFSDFRSIERVNWNFIIPSFQNFSVWFLWLDFLFHSFFLLLNVTFFLNPVERYRRKCYWTLSQK